MTEFSEDVIINRDREKLFDYEIFNVNHKK